MIQPAQLSLEVDQLVDATPETVFGSSPNRRCTSGGSALKAPR